jgi:hypothetical protein
MEKSLGGLGSAKWAGMGAPSALEGLVGLIPKEGAVKIMMVIDLGIHYLPRQSRKQDEE